MIGYYAKALYQGAAAVIAAVAPLLLNSTAGQPVGAEQWVNAAILGLGAVGVYIAPNVPGARYTKVGISAISAGLTLLVSLLTDGITGIEWTQIGLAVLGAVMVGLQENSEEKSTGRHSIDNVRVS